MINKPDVSAPGNLNLYGENIEGTSFSAPYVTGTVVQMIYKDGEEVAHSKATSFSTDRKNTNYEIIELTPEQLIENGAGYYQVKIKREGSAQTSSSIRVGLAWEQP